MARIRTIKPEFPQSQSMGRVSREARLLFILLWTVVDDSGRTRGSSRLLASLLYPYDSDAPIEIDRWIDELEQEGCVVRYRIDGNDYMQVCNWLSHQKIDKPSQSKFPEFDEASRIFSKPRERSSLDQGPRTKDQGPRKGIDCSEPVAPDSKPPESTQEGQDGANPRQEPAKTDDSPVVLEFLCSGFERCWKLRQSKVEEYRDTFPGIDVLAELRKARQWCLDNPTKRKTARGMPAFLGRWLGHEQDRAKVVPSHNGQRADAARQKQPALAPSATKQLSQAELDAKLKAIKEGSYVPDGG